MGYRSKTINNTECNYDIHDKGILAIVQAFHQWKRYTRASPKPVRVLTDHKDFVTFMTTKELSERQARWRQELNQYNFEIQYRPGKKEGKSDVLTRTEKELLTTDSQEMCGSYCQTNNTGISQILKKSTSTIGNNQVSRQKRGRNTESSRDDNEIQNIKRNLDKGKKEMKGIALGLCPWKDNLL